eukprot:768221-Hanusia_phi.AAC.17
MRCELASTRYRKHCSTFWPELAQVKVRKPEASRGRSTEIFLVGVGFKGAVDVQMGQERAEEEEEDRTVLVAEEKPKVETTYL